MFPFARLQWLLWLVVLNSLRRSFKDFENELLATPILCWKVTFIYFSVSECSYGKRTLLSMLTFVYRPIKMENANLDCFTWHLVREVSVKPALKWNIRPVPEPRRTGRRPIQSGLDSQSLNLISSEQSRRFSDQSIKIKACHENRLSHVLIFVLYYLYFQFTQSFMLQKGVAIKITMIEISFIQNKSMLSNTFWTQSVFFPTHGTVWWFIWDRRIPDWELTRAGGF